MNTIINYICQIRTAVIGELQRIIKDPGAVLVFIIAVVAYPVIYSIAYSGEVLRELPVAVVDRSKTDMSRTISRMIDESDEMSVAAQPASMNEATTLFHEGAVNGIILVERNFRKNIHSGESGTLKVYADASYFLFYKTVLEGTLRAGKTMGAGIEIQRLMVYGHHHSQAMEMRDPVPLLTRELHNPFGGYGSFVMPGLIIIILQQTLLVGLGMLGGTAAEGENRYFSLRGNNTTGNISAMLLGRAFAYLLLYLVTGIIVLIWVHRWFGFPDNGSLTALLTLFIPFILSVAFLGIAVSTLFRHREEAFLVLVFLSPVVLFLSGISWPPEAMPDLLYSLGHIMPTNFMVPAYLRLRTMGASLPEVNYELNGLLIQTGFYFLIALWATKKRWRHERTSLVQPFTPTPS